VSSASSIMSELSSAAPLVSQWMQAPAVTEPSDGQPFGAFLDADDTSPPAAPQPAGGLQSGPNFGAGGAQENKTAAAGDVAPRARAADGARWTKGRGAGTAAGRVSDQESRTAPASVTPSSASPGDSGSSADTPANAAQTAATKSGTPDADAAAAGAGATAAATANALALAAAANAPPTPDSKTATGKDDDRDNSAGEAWVPGGPPQALAAAFVLNTGAGAAASGARAAGDAHGQPLGKLNLSSGDAQNAIAGDAKNAPPAKSTPATSDNQVDASNSPDAGSAASGTTTDASQAANPQQPVQVQTADNALLTGLSATIAAGAGGVGSHAAQFSSALAAASVPGGAGAAMSVAASAMANFSLAAGNATSMAASTGADGGVAVPLAGIAIAIAARAQGGTNRFDIRLDPPELGRIEVRLGVDGKGQVTSHVTVDRADTLQLLQSQQSQLQRALEQAGLKTADNGLQFTLRDQSFAGQNNAGNGGGQQSAAQLVIPDSDAAPIDTAQIYSRLRLGGGLDIKV
jgi:flagellar hook-length control protein FliK